MGNWWVPLTLPPSSWRGLRNVFPLSEAWPEAHLAWHGLPTSELLFKEWPSDTVASCIRGFCLTVLESHFVLGHSHLIQVGSLPLHR